ncbi:MAG: hypothetical protein Q7T03_03245 [Deltaproteobacteria bacterium]|nr:hypothetical protein [Deltaproteobacteria bacterium]
MGARPIQREGVYVVTRCQKSNACETNIYTLTVSVEPKPEQTAPKVWEDLVKAAEDLKSTIGGNVRFMGFKEQKMVVADGSTVIDPVAEANSHKTLTDFSNAVSTLNTCRGFRCYM